MKIQAKLILALIGLLLLSLIGSVLLLTVLSQADCVWSVNVYTWMDANGNGVWDVGEAPLPGVALTINDNNYAEVARGFTAADGRAALSVFLPGCPRTAFDIRATAPTGHRFTTPASIQLRDSNTTLYFGFAPEN